MTDYRNERKALIIKLKIDQDIHQTNAAFVTATAFCRPFFYISLLFISIYGIQEKLKYTVKLRIYLYIGKHFFFYFLGPLFGLRNMLIKKTHTLFMRIITINIEYKLSESNFKYHKQICFLSSV